MYTVDQTSIQRVIATIRRGDIAVLPSDTVYGLCVDATNVAAVKKLIQFKQRPPGKPISVFVKDWNMLEDCVQVTSTQRALLQTILPGPYTVVLPSRHIVVPQLESEIGSLGVRLIEAPVINTVMKQLAVPITATSANISGTRAHLSSESFMRSLNKTQRALIGEVYNDVLPRRDPSTVIDLTVSTPNILRATAEGTTYISQNAEETIFYAQKCVKKWISTGLPKMLVVYLHGELGAGKTHFVKGVGALFGIEKITSPTYMGYQVYETAVVRLVHVDLYNTHTRADQDALRLETFMQNESNIPTIMCIEWSEMGELSFKGHHVYITYESLTERRITTI